MDLTRRLREARDAVLERLADFGSPGGANLRARPKRPKSELSFEELWTVEVERAMIAIASGEDCRTLVEALREAIAEGLRRNYSVAQIANGCPSEQYPGVVGVFDDAVDAVSRPNERLQ